MKDPTKRSSWRYLGLGCGVLVVTAVVVGGVLFWLGLRMARDIKTQLGEPRLSTMRAERLLDAELPEGYEASLAVSVPLLGELVALHDPDEPARHLLLVKLRVTEPERRVLQDEAFQRLLEVRGFGFASDQVMGHGEAGAGAQELFYTVHRGRLALQGRSETDVIAAVIEARCSGADADSRLAVWTALDPDPARPGEDLDLAGTPADPAAVRALMTTLDLCRM